MSLSTGFAIPDFGYAPKSSSSKPRYPPKSYQELEQALYKYQNSYASDCFFIQNYNCKMLLPFKNAFPDLDPSIADSERAQAMRAAGYSSAGDYSGTNPYHMDSPADNFMLEDET